jgi:2-C-methyl-D-erythritol 4-phosphate cytidylyltransferase
VYAVTGGDSRTHSVHEAFKKALSLCADPFYACVHDAARPYASTQMIQAVIQAATESGAAACALEVVDTIKEQDESGTLRTLNRASLKAIQTPQVIRSDLFSKGYDNWANGNFQICTDDLQIIESLSVKIALLKGDPKNIKITYQNDI